MIRVAWIVEKSGFQKNFEKFWLRKFSVRFILDTYLLYRELPLPSSCCKGEAWLRISRGKPRVQNCISKGSCGRGPDSRAAPYTTWLYGVKISKAWKKQDSRAWNIIFLFSIKINLISFLIRMSVVTGSIYLDLRYSQWNVTLFEHNESGLNLFQNNTVHIIYILYTYIIDYRVPVPYIMINFKCKQYW